MAVQSKQPAKRLQTSTLSIRCTPELKSLAEAGAKADGRSISNYLAALIRADVARRGVKPPGPAKRRTGKA